MQSEPPPQQRDTPRPQGERRGLVIVHTGPGKGKSTAAFGLALRAHGRGKPVKVYQFMKVPSARFGEHRLFEQLGIPIEGLGDGFSWKSRDLAHSAALAQAGWARAEATVRAGAHFHVALRLDRAGRRAGLPARAAGPRARGAHRARCAGRAGGRRRHRDRDDARETPLQCRRAGAAGH
jgi:hypothetical protein